MKAKRRHNGESLRDVFMSRFEKRGPNECWPWSAGKFTSGYGCIVDNHKSRRANIVAFELFIGPVPDGFEVCHTCDNPPCVNPSHLFVDTHDGNMKDANRKGRIKFARGEKAGPAVLTEAEVVEMRRIYSAGGISFGALSRQFGLYRSTAVKVCRGISWAHVPGAIPYAKTK